MTRIKRVLHDAWCAVTRRCGWDDAADTPVIEWLKAQERDAKQGIHETRQRRRNVIESALRGEIPPDRRAT